MVESTLKFARDVMVFPKQVSANGLLRTRLKAKGYYKAATTPGLWRHKWRPIQFCLIVDDVGVEYMGIEHFNLSLLKKYHGVQFNMAGDKFASIDIKWDYASQCCHISMLGYMDKSNSNIPCHPSRTACHTNACLLPMAPKPN
jgi:hypothetical protein